MSPEAHIDVDFLRIPDIEEADSPGHQIVLTSHDMHRQERVQSKSKFVIEFGVGCGMTKAGSPISWWWPTGYRTLAAMLQKYAFPTWTGEKREYSPN